MFKVGICGTIGSGKSTVCHIFEDMGIPVYFADDITCVVICCDVSRVLRENITDNLVNRVITFLTQSIIHSCKCHFNFIISISA